MRKNNVLSAAAAIAAAVVLCATGLSTTAYAASRTNTAEVLGATRAIGDAGTPAVLGANRASSSVDVTFGDITDASALTGIKSTSKIASVINSALEAAGSDTTVSKKNLDVVASMDLEVPQGTTVSAQDPLYVTFTVPGVTAGTHVYVLHYNHAGHWEVVPSTPGEGSVVAAFTQLSPVAIVVEKDTMTTASKGENSAVSPRTGESQFPIAAVMACAAAIGSAIFVTGRKKAQ